MMKNGCVLVILCCCILAATGCNNGKVPLKGKITFSDDGAPVTCGIVSFSTATFNARGVIKPDGTYVVSSTGTNDGLPPGEYAVMLNNTALIELDANGNEKVTTLVDDKFASTATSGLSIKVDSSTRTYNFTVDRYTNN